MNRTHREEAWLPAFKQLLKDHSSMSFEFGTHDCATIAREVYELSHGCKINLEWDSTIKMARLLKKQRLMTYITNILGDPIPWGRCIIGDIALGVQGVSCEQILSVFDGTHFLIPDEIGFKQIYESDLLVGWRM